MLELVTSRKPVDNGLELAEWALQRHHRGAQFTDVFYRVIDSSGHGSLVKLFKLGVECVNYNPASRPRMDEVFHRLKSYGKKVDTGILPCSAFCWTKLMSYGLN